MRVVADALAEFPRCDGATEDGKTDRKRQTGAGGVAGAAVRATAEGGHMKWRRREPLPVDGLTPVGRKAAVPRHQSRPTLAPVDTLDEDDRAQGMRTMTREVFFSVFADTLVGGVILTAFALHLGATSAGVGMLAAVVFWNQLLQGPGAVLIERLRRRKQIAVIGSLAMAAAPLLMIALAFADPTLDSRLMLVGVVVLYGGAGAIAGCAWNAWVRDVVPDNRRGRFFGRRSTLATATSIGAGLLAAWLLDQHPPGSATRSTAFAGLFALAFVMELLSAWALARAPEPRMPPPTGGPLRLWRIYRSTLADPKFRTWVAFMGSWQFAVNLAQPFFTLFFLRQLGFGMTFVMALSITGLLANLITLSRWGTLADDYTSKSVLNVAAPTFLLCILAMIGASQFEKGTLLQIYLVVLHLVMGTASAGVMLASNNMLLKLSPRGGAQNYIATNALVSAAAAGMAPLLGGFAQDFFAQREFALMLEWTGPRYQGNVLHLTVRAWDFYFLISALFGLYALHRLALVRERGELSRKDMLREMREQSLVRRYMADGFALMGEVPANLIRRSRGRGPPTR
jgi:MFS family permease